MSIPTEPIGSISRPPELLAGAQDFSAGRISRDRLLELYDSAVRDTVRRFEATGSPVITDGEQTKPSFVTYAIHEAKNLVPDGVTIRFADGHVRQCRAWPRRPSGIASTPTAICAKHGVIRLRRSSRP